jgi:Spy/CpxP family protein refolding chaperone
MAENMLRKKIVLILMMTLLALSAGMVVGWVWTPLQKMDTSRDFHGGPRPWFDQLDLSPDQQKQMDKIWTDTRQQRQKMFERFHDLDKQRDQQIQNLLTSDQRSAYDKIIANFRAGREDLNKQRETMISDANARSRALLDDSQKAKWDILSKEMRSRHGSMGSATQWSTTMPSQGEQDHHP